MAGIEQASRAAGGLGSAGELLASQAPARDDGRRGRFSQLLVCLDGSAAGEDALPHAVEVAQAHGARLRLARVLEPGAERSPIDTLDWKVSRTEAGEYLEQLEREVAGRGMRADSNLLQGHAAEQILRFAREERIDLIALTSHGEKGITDWSFASTADKIIARAGVSVLIIPSAWSAARRGTEVRYRRILAPLDGSPRAECVIPSLTCLARSQGAAVILAHVVPLPELTQPSPPSCKDLDLARSLANRNQLVAADLEVHGLVERGMDVRRTLSEIAEREHADLIVASALGSTGRQSRAYGDVARHLIRNATRPLLVVRDKPRLEPPGDQTERRTESAPRGRFFQEST